VPAAHQRHVRFGVSGLNRGVPVTTSLPWKGTTMKLTLIFTLLLNAWAWPAAALNFFELEVYPATTDGKGVHEIEYNSSYAAIAPDSAGDEEEGFPEQGLYRGSLEYNYGLLDKLDVAAYLDLAWPDAEGPQYAGNRFRARGYFWDKGEMPVDLGWYVELEVPQKDAAKLEIEFRPIISRDFWRFSVDLNPQFELPLVADERRTFEFSYSARILYRLHPRVQPALDFFGAIGQIRDINPPTAQEHYIFPSIYTKLATGVYAVVGIGIGYTRASDPLLPRFGIEYEFTL